MELLAGDAQPMPIAAVGLDLDAVGVGELVDEPAEAGAIVAGVAYGRPYQSPFAVR